MKLERKILIENQKIINEIAIDKNLSKSTISSYKSTLKEYCMFNKMSIDELLKEAEYEEEKGIILKKRNIKNRINSYKIYLIKQKNQPLTINTKLAKVKSLYNFYDIEIPNIRLLKKTNHETINDLPSKKDILLVLQNTNDIRFKTIILFLLSSGNSLNETLNITLDDFIKATKDYHNENTLGSCLEKLDKIDVIIPTFSLYRQKTNYPYISFCSHEATKYLIFYLKIRLSHDKNIQLTDKLFNIKYNTLQAQFRRINDRLNFGYVGQYRFFHAHSLRKYFATNLLKADLDPMIIDFLSGRSISKVHEAYFKADPQKLKEKYISIVNYLVINDNYLIEEKKSKNEFDSTYMSQKEYFT